MKFATFRALHREFIELRKAQMGNNERAKKVAMLLEKLARGLTARQFGAFKRYLFLAKAEKAEAERLMALIASKDSAAMQRLKLYLGNKEKKALYGMFAWWQLCTQNSKTRIISKELDKAKKARLAAEAECERIRKELSGEGGMSAAESAAAAKLGAAADRLKDMENESNMLKNDIEAEKRRVKELEDQIAEASTTRKADKAEREKVAEQMKAVEADKKSLEAEMALIVDQIGFLSEYSTKKAPGT